MCYTPTLMVYKPASSRLKPVPPESIYTRVLLNQRLALGLQLGNLRVDVFNLLLNVVVMLLQQLTGFVEVRRRRRGAT